MADAPDLTPITTVIVPLAPTADAVQVIYTNIILVVLVSIWTGLRLYSRRVRRVPFGADDGLYMVSLILFYAFVINQLMMQFLGGAGHHAARLQPWHIERLMKFGYVTQVLYALSLGFLKISICWMLKRIFFIKNFKIAAWVTMSLATSWMLMTILIGMFICRPVAMQWDPTIPGGVCGDQITAFASVGVVDLIVDVIIFVLPIPMVLKLQISSAHRIALLSIFGAGILTIVFGSLRLASVFAVNFLDFSFTSPTAMIWASAEIGVALMVSSSPILRPVFDRIFGRFVSTFRSSAGRTDDNSRYYAGGKKGATGPRTLISAAKHSSRAPDGFTAMSDSEENLETRKMGLKDIQNAERSNSDGRRSEIIHDIFGEGSVRRDDDLLTDRIFVKTEIVQKTT